MSWHSTIESALGLTHPTEVVRSRDGRWHVYCDSCAEYVSHRFGHGNPETAGIVAGRHAERFSLVMPS